MSNKNNNQPGSRRARRARETPRSTPTTPPAHQPHQDPNAGPGDPHAPAPSGAVNGDLRGPRQPDPRPPNGDPRDPAAGERPGADLDGGDPVELVDRHSHRTLFTPEELAEADHRRRLAARTEQARLWWRESVPWMFERAPQTDIRETAPGVIAWTQQRVCEAYENRHLTIRFAPSLLLVGATGTGKTHAAWWAIGHLARAGVITDWEVKTASSMYREQRPQDGPRNPRDLTPAQLLQRWKRVELLVIDDAGGPESTPFTDDVNYQVINARYEAGLPVIITTNLLPERPDNQPRNADTVETLEDKLCARVFSRLVQMVGDNTLSLGVTDLRFGVTGSEGDSQK